VKQILDHGYLKLVELWGSDERIIEAARMSTDKGFEGWGPKGVMCPGTGCGWAGQASDLAGNPRDTGDDRSRCPSCGNTGLNTIPGDEKLLRYLYEHKHSSPFEFAGLVIEVQAPIFVFREWHRHRTQCLGPGTLVHFDAPKSRDNRHYVYKLRIEDIWRRWQPTTRADRPERQVNALFPRSRVQAMLLRNLNEEAREFGHSKIVDVICGEPKEMVQITTASGRRLVATRAHRVMTSVGWMPLGDALVQGALLALEGTTRGKAMRWERPEVDEMTETWVSALGGADYEVSDQGRVRRRGCAPRKAYVGKNGYDVISLSSGGQTTLRTVHSMVLEAFVGRAPAGHEARHMNDNRADARLSNLVWGTSQQNADDRVLADRQQRLVPVFEEIVEAVPVGLQPTYDLTVDGPWHNFVADGFVVHNSYAELSSRYTPLPDFNYVPTVERLMINSKRNKQAGAVAGSAELSPEVAEAFQAGISRHYADAEEIYQAYLEAGVPKELARVHLPVGRYSRMRASANLRNWLLFLTLRMDKNAQWEIRQYANAVDELIAECFPRTWALFAEGRS
jgi:thymidylate synthase ThyX